MNKYYSKYFSKVQTAKDCKDNKVKKAKKAENNITLVAGLMQILFLADKVQ